MECMLPDGRWYCRLTNCFVGAVGRLHTETSVVLEGAHQKSPLFLDNPLLCLLRRSFITFTVGSRELGLQHRV